MPSKWLWEPLIKSYEKILNFINRKFIDGKVISPPQKHSDFSKRNVIKNSVFNSKNMRNTVEFVLNTPPPRENFSS